MTTPPNFLQPTDSFIHRHIGPTDADIREMLATLGLTSLDALIDATVPDEIRMRQPLAFGRPRGEFDVLGELRTLHDRNQVFRSFIGMGYYDCITPPVIQRNILENPGWYTQYTPYQAEIAQGRLEALLNFQTMVCDLTGMAVANASMLDEATAAAEAMTLAKRVLEKRKDADTFLGADHCHPQTIDVVRTRAEPLGLNVVVGDWKSFAFDEHTFGVLVQYPASDGEIADVKRVIDAAHAKGSLAVVATDLLALTLLKPPGELGADVVVGNSQRFGVPLFAGGPHAAFFACQEDHQRKMPGRIVGVSIDAMGKRALRLALQTREQHIRRDRATSNICTAQVLLAVTASMYAVYHG